MPDELIVMDIAHCNADNIKAFLKRRCGVENLQEADLGFELPMGWPHRELTLAQLTVLAKKFGYQIKIQSIELCKINIQKAETENTADAATK